MLAVTVLPHDGGSGQRVQVRALPESNIHPADAAFRVGPREDGPVTVGAGLVLVLGVELSGPGVSSGDVLAATSGVMGALEVSGTGLPWLVLGPAVVSPEGLDLALVGVLLDVDGSQVATAAGAAAVNGHPAAAAAAAVNAQGPDGGGVPAGSLIFTGALTPPFALVSGSHVRATFGHLGSVGVRLV